ncbi:MAG: hypothetical protein ACR2OZ_20885 [Verrucomicrobiales bacterium]
MFRLLLVLCALATISISATGEIELSPALTARIGQRIWKNECGGTVDGLTSWNKGEDFPSLGIGHFIWYPAGMNGPFEESFPPLLGFMKRRGTQVPAWLEHTSHCPWPNREAFLAEWDGERLSSLRRFLAHTVGLQAEFAAHRARKALPKVLAAAPAESRAALARKYDTVASVPNGVYALVDYVNFKGEGSNPKERYKGQGWGLLQVLAEMQPVNPGPAAALEFSAAAKRVLARRIANAPRNESQWRSGWFSRCDSYSKPF